MTGTENRVLVAVGPEGVHGGALTFAAEEATRRGTGIELLHVVRTRVTGGDGLEHLQALDSSLTESGRRALTAAAERLRDLVEDEVPVATEIRSGPVVSSIVDRAAVGDLVVLERRDVGTVERLLTMSVSTRVAAHAHVPVAVVPQSWVPHPVLERPVVVGVDSSTDPLGQVREALAYAELAHLPLEVLHATWLAEPWQDLAFGNDTRAQWIREAERELDKALAEVAGGPVPVTRDVQWRRPVDALAGATRRAAVVVLNRRHERGLAPHLGATTRTVLRYAECPVLVVDRD
ncbi:universal stress protein [Nocardioides caricicola]|uniref:Universal stress protein n=1 Tax=Nocardioides caricicola TaxID=634770 RepID=A0ABW0N764_9ACTN